MAGLVAAVHDPGPGPFVVGPAVGVSSRDLAAAVARLTGDGLTISEIAAVCALKPYHVSAYRQADKFPPALAERMDNADMRALYDLYRQWTKTPDTVLAALPEASTYLSVTEARRIIEALTDRPTGSIVLARERVHTRTSFNREPDADERAREMSLLPSHLATLPPGDGVDILNANGRTNQATAFTGNSVFIVAIGAGQHGRLIVDRRANQKDHVLVQLEFGIEAVALADVRIVRVE